MADVSQVIYLSGQKSRHYLLGHRQAVMGFRNLNGDLFTLYCPLGGCIRLLCFKTETFDAHRTAKYTKWIICSYWFIHFSHQNGWSLISAMEVYCFDVMWSVHQTLGCAVDDIRQKFLLNENVGKSCWPMTSLGQQIVTPLLHDSDTLYSGRLLLIPPLPQLFMQEV